MVFRNEFYFLSNMFPCHFTMDINGKTLTFPSSESAFQAMKCPAMANLFAVNPDMAYPDGFKAKKGGRKVPLRPDWEQVKISVMAEVLAAKFGQNPELEKKLLAIKGEIAEDNTWNDTFWGICKGKGQNWLGRLLMQIRNNPPSRQGTPKMWLSNLGVDQGV